MDLVVAGAIIKKFIDVFQGVLVGQYHMLTLVYPLTDFEDYRTWISFELLVYVSFESLKSRGVAGVGWEAEGGRE